MKVELYIPNKDRDGDTIESAMVVDVTKTVIDAILEKFGGCNVHESIGYWKSGSKRMQERCLVITVIIDDGENSVLVDKWFHVEAQAIGALLNQECVMYVVSDGKATFVSDGGKDV